MRPRSALSRTGRDASGCRRSAAAGAAALLALALAASARAEEPSPADDDSANPTDLGELNKHLTKPVSSLWSITFQQNNFRLDPGLGQSERWSSNPLFQPVLPKLVKGTLSKPSEPYFRL